MESTPGYEFWRYARRPSTYRYAYVDFGDSAAVAYYTVDSVSATLSFALPPADDHGTDDNHGS